MAFPSNPIDGEIYGKYVYNETNNLWEVSVYSESDILNLIKGINSNLATGTDSQMSGSSYPFWSQTVCNANEVANGTKVIFGFVGRHSGGTGFPRLYLHRQDWSWSLLVSANSTDWKLAASVATIGGNENQNLVLALYHFSHGASGTSYARQPFVSIIKN